MFYVYARLSGFHVSVKQMTSDGRIDMVIELKDKIYLFEFKIDESAESAIEQIKKKMYYKPFETKGKTIFLLGVSFNSKARKIENWLMEEMILK